METESFIIELFCRVDDQIGAEEREPLAKLCPSEIVTLGMLFALKSQGNRQFYRWCSREWRHLFPRLPERTRLFRLFAKYRQLTDEFFATLGLFGVADTIGLELLHPYREGRSATQIGRKGLSNHRWFVGVKLCILVNHLGLPVAWECREGNVADKDFQQYVADFAGESIVFVDSGFHAAAGDRPNIVICKKGERNQRMVVETLNSILTGGVILKRLYHRTWEALSAHIGYALALVCLLAQWHWERHPDDNFRALSVAQFRL